MTTPFDVKPSDALTAKGVALEPEHLSDLGNARRFVTAHGHDVRYVHAWGKWLWWDGMRWTHDETGEILRRAKDTVRQMYAEAGYTENEDQRDRLGRHALRSESERALHAMVSLAESEPGIPITPAELDRGSYLLNVLNGTLQLPNDPEAGPACLKKHDRSDYITKLVPVAYDPAATCPTWLAFLDRILGGKEAIQKFLQRAIGYSLTGDTREQVLIILVGRGANGKSTLIVTVSSALGDYAMSTPVETLLVKKGDTISNDLARLPGARFVAAMEADGHRHMAESTVKQLTGGDRITARFLHHEFFEYTPTFKIFLSTNHRPIIKGTDHAIWRRIRLVPFEVVIPEEEQDQTLAVKLREELPGILRWAVEGCEDWQRHGLGVPEEVRAATAKYRADLDVLGEFLGEKCVKDEGAAILSSALYGSYLSWCHENNEKPVTATAFGLRLRDAEIPSKKTHAGKEWHGIRLRTDADPLNDGLNPSQTAFPGFSSYSEPHEELTRTTRKPVTNPSPPDWVTE